MNDEVRLFVSYSHKDEFWMQALMPLLKFPQVQVRPWNDKELQPGVRWDVEIKKALAEMDIFVALVSVNFAVSNYIATVEGPAAQERSEKGEIEVVPVLIHDPDQEECKWLTAFQRVPPGAKSWVDFRKENSEYDEALAPIRNGIKAVVQRVLDRRRQGSG